jgi:hypothetical protein
MCFSAGASFSAGVVLTVIGIASIKKTHHGSQLLFASIPLIFGIQQLTEGILWVTIPNPNYVNTQKVFTYVYLLIAQVFWPLWVPMSILLLEKNRSRKKIQRVLVAAGLIVGAFLAYYLLNYKVEAKIVGQHVTYLQNYPISLKSSMVVLYALATIAPSFFSHVKHMWLLGTTILLSYLVTAIFYDHYVLSVWCFFSSIISLAIYLIISKSVKHLEPVK